jgi:prepilin-type N-terminal cleavage/methylation domain-containing protein
VCGFSLLEVLIAMFILSIGAASVLALFAAAASTHKRSVDRTHAALLAERLFSDIQGRYEPEMTAKELTKLVEDEVPEAWGNYTWEVYLFHPAEGAAFGRRRGDEDDEEWSEDELFARIIIRWQQKANARSVTFHSILLPRNVGESSERRTTKKRSGGKLGASPF